MEGTAHNVLLSVAFQNADGTYTQVTSQPEEAAMLGYTKAEATFDCDYAFPTGGYQLIIIESSDQGATWQPCRGSQTYGVTVKVEEQAILSPSDIPEETIVIDGLRYQLSRTTFEATICANDYEGRIIIPASITYNGVQFPVTAIDENCFNECEGVTSVTIPESITSLPSFCFENCSALEEVNIPNTVTSIGVFCFSFCRSLKNVTLPKSITALPMACFAECEAITDVVIPSHITALKDYSYSGCTGLQTIDLHENITALGEQCFAACSSAKTLICRIKTPLPIDSLFISNCNDNPNPTAFKDPTDFKSDCVLYVPAESLDAYKTADVWKNFTTILPIDPTAIRQAAADGLTIAVNGDQVTLSGLTDGTTARFHTPDGQLIATAVATNGSATVQLSEPLVIARVGQQAVKIVTGK